MDMTGVGRVVDYDFDRGLGVVEIVAGLDDGGPMPRRLDFHCTAIADGSRRIDPNTPVVADIGPAGPGRWEARRLRSVAELA